MEVGTVQTRLQMGFVERLEEHLTEERSRLAAMIDHINRDQGRGQPGSSIGSLEMSNNNSLKKPRPSQTYASMIREVTVCSIHSTSFRENSTNFLKRVSLKYLQAILESEHQQLALNDIYTWFQDKYSSYFNSNTATWKVRG